MRRPVHKKKKLLLQPNFCKDGERFLIYRVARKTTSINIKLTVYYTVSEMK